MAVVNFFNAELSTIWVPCPLFCWKIKAVELRLVGSGFCTSFILFLKIAFGVAPVTRWVNFHQIVKRWNEQNEIRKGIQIQLDKIEETGKKF